MKRKFIILIFILIMVLSSFSFTFAVEPTIIPVSIPSNTHSTTMFYYNESISYYLTKYDYVIAYSIGDRVTIFGTKKSDLSNDVFNA